MGCRVAPVWEEVIHCCIAWWYSSNWRYWLLQCESPLRKNDIGAILFKYSLKLKKKLFFRIEGAHNTATKTELAIVEFEFEFFPDNHSSDGKAGRGTDNASHFVCRRWTVWIFSSSCCFDLFIARAEAQSASFRPDLVMNSIKIAVCNSVSRIYFV